MRVTVEAVEVVRVCDVLKIATWRPRESHGWEDDLMVLLLALKDVGDIYIYIINYI